MATKRPKPEEIVTKLRQVEVPAGQGMPRLDAILTIGVTEQTYCRWKKECGGMGTDQLKEPNRRQKENERLRKAVSDLTLGKQADLDGSREGKFLSPACRRARIDHVRTELNASERRAWITHIVTAIAAKHGCSWSSAPLWLPSHGRMA